MYFRHCKSILLCVIFISLSPYSVAQTASQAEDFAKAAKFDDISEVKSLIAKGISPNTVDSKGNPMLVLAIKDKSYWCDGVIAPKPEYRRRFIK
jgi:hypothetical protein